MGGRGSKSGNSAGFARAINIVRRENKTSRLDDLKDLLNDPTRPNSWTPSQKKKLLAEIEKEKGYRKMMRLGSMGNTREPVEVRVLPSVPNGWRVIEGATTAPKGYKWYDNGQSRFGEKYESALIKNN